MLTTTAGAIHWIGDLLEWIADSWSPQDDADEELPGILDFKGSAPDDEISIEALDKEQLIRGVVTNCVAQELSAETIRLNMMGLCRSLGALSQMAAEGSSHKQTCMEAAGVIAVTTSCERMLRSVSGFQLIQHYRFMAGDPEA